jgi:hypothetical protein
MDSRDDGLSVRETDVATREEPVHRPDGGSRRERALPARPGVPRSAVISGIWTVAGFAIALAAVWMLLDIQESRQQVDCNQNSAQLEQQWQEPVDC